MKHNSLLKQPSAWFPIAMSLAALALLLVYVAFFGIVQHEAEIITVNNI